MNGLPPILLVTGEYPPDVGGVGDYTLQLRRALGQRGCFSRVLSRRAVGRWDARSLVYVVRAVPRSTTSVVHIQFQAAAFDLLGDVCMMPLALRRTRPHASVVTTFHDVRVPYLFPKAGALRWRAVQLLARTSHAVATADERDLAALGGPSPRHHLLPIGSNVDCIPPAAYDRDAWRANHGLTDLAVAYFGLLNASKGLDVVLNAFDLVSKERPAARLLLLGGSVGASDHTNPQTAAELAVRVRAFGERVIQTGFLAGPELSAWLLAADVALLPYVDGASPRRGSLLACAAHGLPIVSTTPLSGAVADAVVAIGPGDVRAAAAAVLRLHVDEAMRRRQRAASRALAGRTSWSRIAEAHVALYRTLAAV